MPTDCNSKVRSENEMDGKDLATLRHDGWPDRALRFQSVPQRLCISLAGKEVRYESLVNQFSHDPSGSISERTQARPVLFTAYHFEFVRNAKLQLCVAIQNTIKN